MPRDVREYVKAVEELGELKQIEGADWFLEIGAIAQLAGTIPNPPVLLFDKVKGYPAGYRVLLPTTSSPVRASIQLEISRQLNTKQEAVSVLREKLSQPFKPIPPLQVKAGPVLENIQTGSDVDLFKFPVPQWFATDGGRYIGVHDTVIMRDPDEGWVNVSVQRIQIQDKTTATIFIEPGKQGDKIRRKYWERGEACPVAVTCGGDLLVFIAAAMPMPWGLSEYDWVGWWRGEPLEVINGPLTGLPIPALSEIALEGELLPPEVETRKEGPFPEWTGHYAPATREPVFKVKSVTHRNDPIWVGQPFLGAGGSMGLTRSLLYSADVWNTLEKTIPAVKGVWNHDRCFFVSIAQQYPEHARETALAVINHRSRIMNLVAEKFIVIVDDDVDPFDPQDVLFAIMMRCDTEHLEIVKGTRTRLLDPLLSAEKREAGDFTHSAVLILACKPYQWIKDFPPRVRTDPELIRKARDKWGCNLSQ